MNKHFRDNVVFVLVSTAVFMSEPAIVLAQADPYNPVNFTEPLNLYRGKISPVSPDAMYLNEEDMCKIQKEEWGWDSCGEIQAIIIEHTPGIDTLLVETVNSEGFVEFDDWEGADRQEEIDAIWQEFVAGAEAQGKKLGQSIVPVKWFVYPTLNKEKSYLYYAILIDWDGELVINAKASLFDRKGYVPFRMIPTNSNISEGELQRLVEISLNSYTPEGQQAYLDFQNGDKIAAAGALGVLAALVGVKYGKAAAAGVFAILLILAKKAWFLLLIPLIFLKRFIFGQKTE